MDRQQRAIAAIILYLSVAQTSLFAQSTQPTEATFDFGSDWIHLPVNERVNKTSPRTVELLGQALSSEPAAERRAELVTDLGSCELPSAAPFLMRALSDTDEAVRASAARSAGMVGAKELLAPLRSAMADQSNVVRREVVFSGATLGDASLVTQGLSDKDQGVFVAACRSASTKEHGEVIAARLHRDQEADGLSLESRVAAIAALGKLKEVEHAGDLLPFLHASVAEQVAALESLAAMNASSAVDQAATLLASPNPSVRRATIVAMTQLAPAERQSAIGLQMLNDPDATVRVAAANLLAASPTATAVPLLVKRLADPFVPLHDAAIDSLVAVKAEDAAVHLLETIDPRRREDGSYILGKLKSAAGFDRHLSLLGDEDWAVVDQAARSLVLIGRPEAGAAMSQVTRHLPTLTTDVPSAKLFDASLACGDALVAAIKFGNTAPFEDGKALIGNPQALGYPRDAAIWAFGMMGKPDPRICGALFKILGDPMESVDAQLEAVKALGNLRYKPAVQVLEKYGPTAADLQAWMVHASLDRINGVTTPYIIPPSTWQARVSITDLTDR